MSLIFGINLSDRIYLSADTRLTIEKSDGTKEYRDKLESLNWEPFANTQISQITKLRKIAKSEPPLVISSTDALATRKKIIQYAEESIQKYPKNRPGQYYAVKDEKEIFALFPRQSLNPSQNLYWP